MKYKRIGLINLEFGNVLVFTVTESFKKKQGKYCFLIVLNEDYENKIVELERNYMEKIVCDGILFAYVDKISKDVCDMFFLHVIVKNL